jgi:paraquat-inducible protein B
MSEYDAHDKERRKDPQPPDEHPEAKVHLAKWSPWIWVLPALAIFTVGYLVVRYGLFGGGDITVRFAEARGLDRYSPVKYRGAKVGTVQKITIDEAMGQVVVRISMDAAMDDALRTGTHFWIVEPGIEGGGLGGLLSGTYVGIAPGEGDSTREFQGQEYPPVLYATEAGKTFLLEAHGLGSIAVGSPVQFQGMRVGRILGAEYDAKRGVTTVHAFVVQRFVDYVRQSTRWWRGGGLNVSLSGGGVSMGGAGIASLLTAPVSFYTPEVMAGTPVAERTRFTLFESEATAIAAADGPHLTYLTYFPGPIHGLTPGTPVQMKGVTVGRVRDVRLRYVPQTATLETPVMLEIDPRKLELPITPVTTREELRVRMNDALASLVRKGMRANLATSLVLPGASAVSLDITAAPNTGRLVLTNDPPIIPAGQGDNGIGGAMASISRIADTINQLPLREMAEHMRSTAARLDTLVSDPRLSDSIQRLNASLADMEKVAATVRENAGPIVKSARNAATSAEQAAATANANVEPIVRSLRNAAASAEAAAKSAEGLMGTSQKQNYDVGNLIRELTRAAEAVRALADSLNEHPDALLKGRAK